MDYKGIKGAVRLTSADIKSRYPTLFDWFDDFLRGWNLYHNALILEETEYGPAPEKSYDAREVLHASQKTYVRLSFFLYTATQEYRISVRPPGADGQDTGYLGCTVKNRMPHPGEDWIRGNDLTDGGFSYDTFRKIIFDIARREIVQLNIQETVRGLTPAGGVIEVPNPGVPLPPVVSSVGKSNMLGHPSDEKFPGRTP